MPSIVICPACSQKLRLKTEPLAGKRIRCPRCQEIFAQASESESLSEGEDWGEDSYDEEPLPPVRRRKTSQPTEKRKSKRKSQGTTSRALWIGIAAAATVSLIGVVVALQILVSRPGSNTAGGAQETLEASSVSAPPTINTGVPITDAECVAFGSAMEEAVATRNHQSFRRLANLEAAMDKVVHGIDLSSQQKASFRRGVSQSIPNISNNLFSQIGEGGYIYLRTMTNPSGVRQALFRVSQDDGVNYHRYDLIRNSAQQVVAGDIYIYASGEYFSTTMRRVMLPLVASENRSILDRLTGADNVLVTNLPKLQKLQQAVQSGQHSQAIQIYKTLPAELQQKKFVLLLRFASASHVSNAEYLATMEDFRRHHEGDVCLDLLLIDYFFLKNQMSECYAAIDRLDAAVGRDPYLQVFRAGLMMQEGRHADARKTLESVLDDDSVAAEAYAALLDVVIAEQDHAATAEALRALRDYGYEFEDLAAIPDFAHFVKSTEYERWLAQ